MEESLIDRKAFRPVFFLCAENRRPFLGGRVSKIDSHKLAYQH